MRHNYFFHIDPSIICLLLFAGCILMVIAGKAIRNKFLHKDEQDSRGGVNSLLGALFGLWGFILAFTFGNAASRFENIRTMMVDEANVMRTAILRAETFPDSIRNEYKLDLRKYLESRIAYYNYEESSDEFNKTKQDAIDVGKRLWTRTVKVSSFPNLAPASNAMMATLTSMFDVAAKRDALLLSGIPLMISSMLFFLALAISFVGGFTTPVLKTKEWIVIAGFILLACIIIYITIDLSRPTTGFIRPDVGQDRIVQLRTLF
jgi:hypothetical protein